MRHSLGIRRALQGSIFEDDGEQYIYIISPN